MISLKKINNVIIKPIPDILTGEGLDKRQIKGHDMFKEVYANIFLLARKKSGKTSTIYAILKKCIGKNTTVIMFVSTHKKDKSYRAIKKFLKHNGVPCVAYEDFFDEKKKNILENIVNGLTRDIPDDEDEDSPKKICFNMYGNEEEDEDEQKEKFLAPEYIFIIDDMSSEMRIPIVQKLLKINRHIRSKCILSSQHLHDIPPGALRQIDNFIAFGGLPEEKLKLLYQYADMAMDYETFVKLYKHATAEKYNFMYIDVPNDEIRKNFNHIYNFST